MSKTTVDQKQVLKNLVKELKSLRKELAFRQKITVEQVRLVGIVTKLKCLNMLSDVLKKNSIENAAQTDKR